MAKVNKTTTPMVDTATVDYVGFSVNGETVIFVIGENDAIGTRFRMTVTSGEYQYYDPDYTRDLPGRRVEFTYTGVNDVRVPTGVAFLNFLPPEIIQRVVEEGVE